MAKRAALALLVGGCCLTVCGAEPGPDAAPAAASGQVSDELPGLRCVPEQTGGFHDYPGGEETYEPALFHPRPFELEVNQVFMLTLAGKEGAPDLFVTMQTSVEEQAQPELTELECRRVRGADGSPGYSCVNLPPSEMLLINAQTFRFTLTAVGGWTFAGAAGNLGGDSIFVEYGLCQPLASAPSETPPAERLAPGVSAP